MTIAQGIELFKSAYLDTTIFSVDFILPTIIILLSLLFITREINAWKTLALPVSFAWLTAGVQTTFLFYVVATIIFVIDTMSLQALAGGLSVLRNRLVTNEDTLTRRIGAAATLSAPQKYKAWFKNTTPTQDIHKHNKIGTILNIGEEGIQIIKKEEEPMQTKLK